MAITSSSNLPFIVDSGCLTIAKYRRALTRAPNKDEAPLIAKAISYDFAAIIDIRCPTVIAAKDT